MYSLDKDWVIVLFNTLIDIRIHLSSNLDCATAVYHMTSTYYYLQAAIAFSCTERNNFTLYYPTRKTFLDDSFIIFFHSRLTGYYPWFDFYLNSLSISPVIKSLCISQ